MDMLINSDWLHILAGTSIKNLIKCACLFLTNVNCCKGGLIVVKEASLGQYSIKYNTKWTGAHQKGFWTENNNTEMFVATWGPS